MNNSLRLQQIAARGHHIIEKTPTQRWSLPIELQFGAKTSALCMSWQDDKLFFTLTQLVDELERAYLEAFAELASKLNWAKLQVLGTRELESFLRDHNSTPAHALDLATPPGLWLEKLRTHLLLPWLSARLYAPSQTLHVETTAMELAQWLGRLNEAFWGNRIAPSISQSRAIGLIPMPHGHEVRWYFPPNAEAQSARELCRVLEQTFHERGLTVKVVAES